MNNEIKNNSAELNDSDIENVSGGSENNVNHNLDALNELNNLNKHQYDIIGKKAPAFTPKDTDNYTWDNIRPDSNQR